MTVSSGEYILRHLRNKADQVYRLKANEMQSIHSQYNKWPVVFVIMPSIRMYFKLSFHNKTFACVFHITHNYIGRMYRPAPDIFSKQTKL